MEWYNNRFKTVQPIMRKYSCKGQIVYAVDTEKSSFRGITVKNLGGYGRRKFENLIYLENVRDNPVFLYE